jgi:hypothetical protein
MQLHMGLADAWLTPTMLTQKLTPGRGSCPGQDKTGHR